MLIRGNIYDKPTLAIIHLSNYSNLWPFKSFNSKGNECFDTKFYTGMLVDKKVNFNINL